MPRSREAPSAPETDLVAAFERAAERLGRARAQLIDLNPGLEVPAELALAAAVAGGWAMMVGPPGSGKTVLAQTLAATLGVSLGRHAFTPDSHFDALARPAETRRLDAAARPRGHAGPLLHEMFLAEDLDRARPRVRSELLEAAHEGVIHLGGETFPLARPFQLLAGSTQEGVISFDETEADRFLMHIVLPAPDRSAERRLLMEAGRPRAPATPVMDAAGLVEAQRVAVELPVGEKVVEAILDLVRRARPEDPSAPPLVGQAVVRGPGPRAGQALMRLSRALALIDGRPSPSVADVRRLAGPVLQHRLVLARGAAVSGAQVMAALLEATS